MTCVVARMVEIRNAIAEDWEEFHKMDVQIFPEDEAWEDTFRKRVEGDGFFILEIGNDMIGYLMVQRYGSDEGYVGRIGVIESQRGKGYGRLLMDQGIDWFRNQGDIKAVHLQADLNEAALGLYKNTGFKKVGTTWHYFVPFDSLEPKGEYSVHEIKESEFNIITDMFPTVPAEQLRRFLEDKKNLIVVLKDGESNIQGVARFTPSFPGCFPFEITYVECFDDFVLGLKKFSLPEYDYARITFTNIPELAEICKKRNYRMHHKLHKMTLVLYK